MKRLLPIMTLALLPLVWTARPAMASIPETVADETEMEARDLFVARKCEVRGIGENRTVVLFDEFSRETHEIKLSEKVKLRAVKKKEFDGRKKLDFEDFAVGQRVKVNIRKSDGRILRIDVLPRAE